MTAGGLMFFKTVSPAFMAFLLGEKHPYSVVGGKRSGDDCGRLLLLVFVSQPLQTNALSWGFVAISGLLVSLAVWTTTLDNFYQHSLTKKLLKSDYNHDSTEEYI